MTFMTVFKLRLDFRIFFYFVFLNVLSAFMATCLTIKKYNAKEVLALKKVYIIDTRYIKRIHLQLKT